MIKQINIAFTLKFALIEALVFIVPAFFFVRDSNYTHSWLLFLGSALFAIVTAFCSAADTHKRSGTELSTSLLFNSMVAIVAGIVLSCILSLLLLALMDRNYLGSGAASKILSQAPGDTVHGKTNGMAAELFMAAVIANFSFASFAALITPSFIARGGNKKSPKVS